MAYGERGEVSAAIKTKYEMGPFNVNTSSGAHLFILRRSLVRPLVQLMKKAKCIDKKKLVSN